MYICKNVDSAFKPYKVYGIINIARLQIPITLQINVYARNRLL